MNVTQRQGALRRALVGLFALLACAAAPSPVRAVTPPDPAAPGPYHVSKEEYNFGDTYATDPGFPYTKLAGFPGPVEFIGSVMYPSTTDASDVPLKGHFPLIVFLHGRHSPSYNLADQSTSMAWPPGAGQAAIPSYEGYDYASSVLASHGYVVISISADGVNARDNMTPDRGMLVRAQLIQAHLDF